jgi:hypothetical protein
MKPFTFLVAAMTFFAIALSSAHAQTVLTASEAAKVLRFQNLNVTPERISGTIINESPHMVRDVQLLIQYHWLWENERNPGQNPPGRAVTVNLDKELKPGDSVPFSYTPSPPLPQRRDGQFMPEVDVAGFTVVVPQRTAAR